MNGATLKLVEGFTAAKYLIIHNKSNKHQAFAFNGVGPKLVAKAEIEEMFVTKKDAELYLVYDVDTSITLILGDLDFSVITSSGDSYSPHLIPIEGLKK